MTELWAALVAMLMLAGAFVAGDLYRGKVDTASQAGGKQVHTLQIKDAKDAKAINNEDLHEFILAKPAPVIRLCDTAVQAPVAASPAASASPVVGESVHAGDHAVRPAADPPDIGPLLKAFGAVFDAKMNDLREQQAVP